MFSSKYFIYLDTKIIGAATQIVNFFDNQVFNANDVVILVKKYKHKSAKKIKEIFIKAGLRFLFIKMSDIDLLTEGFIFYPFNAQSNVRVAANRKLTHIFITHGESNKAASVKPIIRVYDYVVTAGQAGIDRFLANYIFNASDIASGRLIKMGDTFVGSTGLDRKFSDSSPCIFYAPTWEGGIESENYSSLANVKKLSRMLMGLVKKYGINKIVIRPHPNTGSRLKIYRKHLLELLKSLSEQGVEPILLIKDFKLTLMEKWGLKQYQVLWKNTISQYRAIYGVCDISAMETQMLNENIPYSLYWDNERYPNTLYNPDIYHTVSDDFPHWWIINTAKISQENYKNYVIDEEISSCSIESRINLLINKTQ